MTFWQRLAETLKKLLSSGKVLTAIAGFVVVIAAKRGIILSPDDVNLALTLFAVLIGAQGFNDWGKGAAQVTAAAPPKPEQVNVQNVTNAPATVAPNRLR